MTIRGYQITIQFNFYFAHAMACDALGSGFNPTNAEVTAFAATAGITDPATLKALDALVTGLKKATAWTQLDAVYPFVGGTSTTCSYNLIDPSKYRITWNGAVSFDTTGITGGGGYGDTGFVPSGAGGNFSLNSASLGIYCRDATATAGSYFIGGTSGLGLDSSYLALNGPGQAFARINQNGANLLSSPATFKGNMIASRTAANSVTMYLADGTSLNVADASTNLTAFSLFILAANQGGGGAGIPSSSNLAFAFIGAGFNAGIVALIESAITTFNTTLGRA